MIDSRTRVAHIGIAVASIDAALGFYRDVLGLEPGHPETADGATIVGLPLGDVQVELLEPRDPDGPVAKFLARRGPGIHHVCYRVPDLDRALERRRPAHRVRASEDDGRHLGGADRVETRDEPPKFPRRQLLHGDAGFGMLARSVPTTSQRPPFVSATSIGTTTVHDVERCSSTRNTRRSGLFGTGSGPSMTRYPTWFR